MRDAPSTSTETAKSCCRRANGAQLKRQRFADIARPLGHVFRRVLVCALALQGQEAKIEDWNALESGYARLADALSARNADAFMGLLTQKATWDFGQPHPMRFPVIKAFMATFLTGLPEGSLGYTLEAVQMKGPALQATVSFFRSEGAAHPVVTGRWFDTWEKTPSGWKMRHRELLVRPN